MSITYPLSLPTSPGARALKMIELNLVGSTIGEFDMQEQVQEWAGERFEATITLPAMTRAQAAVWCAMLSALRGILGTFLLPVYACRNPQGTATSATVNGAHAAGAKVLNVTMTGTLKAGDYLQITEQSGSPLVNYARLHKVLNDQSGSGALDIWPRLRGALTGSEAITLVNPMGTFRLADNKRSWDIDEAQLIGISFNAREAL